MKVLSTSFGLPQSDARESHDAFAVKVWDETLLAVLADGAGSSRAAQEAAQRAVRSFLNHFETRPRTWPPPRALAEFTRLINRALHQDSLARFGEPELVTTLSVAVVQGDRLYGLNVGDSPVFLARNGQLTRLSQGHAGEAAGFQHVLGRALGLAPEVEPHQFEHDLRDGDVALLCSDGISNVLDEKVLAEKLGRRSAARAIVCSARESADAETRDDMSAIVLDIQHAPKSPRPDEPRPAIPGKLHKGLVIDGFTLIRPFQHSERVWLASRDGQRFTLKFAPLEALESEEHAALFTRETLNATRLQDTRFFPRAFVPERATHHFYAMEFVEAPSLRTLLRSRALSADEAVALGKFLLAAAQYLLRFDLVHGDFKPENLLVLSDYDRIRFKLVDFGSVTEVFSVSSRAGTASYLAPERFHDSPISERTEIFAIGVTLFEAVTRSFPFGEIERFQTPRFQHLKRPGVLNPNLPPWFEAVLLRSLSPVPERRYQNFSEMLFDLENPGQVAPFHPPHMSLVERNPVLFYKTGFYLLLALVLVLLTLLLKH